MHNESGKKLLSVKKQSPNFSVQKLIPLNVDKIYENKEQYLTSSAKDFDINHT